MVMPRVILFLILGLATSVQADVKSRAKCSSECSSCRVRCHGNKACMHTCYEFKRSCCQSCHEGPGPITTCACG